jgi:hypothetical protein
VVNREGFTSTVAKFNKKFNVSSLWHSRDGTPKHTDNNRCHSERDCCRSTTTQLWNAHIQTSSNHTEVSAHCCHGKHMVASSWTSLSDLVSVIIWSCHKKFTKH